MSRVVCSWSGGKDAAVALDVLSRDPTSTVTGLLTTVIRPHDRVTMHGVRRSLIARQAEAVGLSLDVVELPADVSNDGYEERMATASAALAGRGIDAVAFGDLALDDVRTYRVERLRASPLDGRWPVWGWETDSFAEHVIDRGFRAVIVCVDGAVLDTGALGRTYDRAFITDLPDEVDPCGEDGAFHTFVVDGPTFGRRVAVEHGETVSRETDGGLFHYLDLRATENG